MPTALIVSDEPDSAVTTGAAATPRTPPVQKSDAALPQMDDDSVDLTVVSESAVSGSYLSRWSLRRV